MSIRTATTQDGDQIHLLYLSAFPEEEREIVAKLAIDLLSENSTPETRSLIAETDGSITGHATFSPVTINNNDHYQGYILAPLAVHPDHQKGGIGSALIRQGIQQLSASGVNILFVYGDPNYYGRFGFEVDNAHTYIPPCPLHYPEGWQALILNECVLKEVPVTLRCVASLNDPELW